jgi:hypothetical protein
MDVDNGNPIRIIGDDLIGSFMSVGNLVSNGEEFGQDVDVHCLGG